MTAAADPRLLQEFLDCGQVGILDDEDKAAFRLCSKQIKDYVDATVTACTVKPDDLDALLNCNWPLKEVEIFLDEDNEDNMPPESITSLLSDLICKFPLLEKLVIDELNELAELPENIGVLSQLKHFVINGCRELKALPPSFGQLTTLELFELAGCAALSFDGLGPLKHLKQLKHFRILGDIVSEPSFPDWVCSCDFPLENLCLGGGSTFPEGLTNFKNLTELTLHFRVHASNLEVSESISALSLLRNLELSSDKPISLPDSFSKLTSLEELWINADTDKEDIAPLQHLTGLTKLTVGKFLIEDESITYPGFLGNFTLLKYLGLWNSKVHSLPDALGNLKNLELLRLEELYDLEEIPESIGCLSSLTCIIFYHCSGLKRLPDSIGNLAALKYLMLESCYGLESLPESFGNLKNLQTLNISSTRVSRLPSSIGSLGSLEYFYVSDCEKLHELPDSVGNLNALKVLKIFDCFKLYIPDSFADLVLGKAYEDWSLQQIWFTGCRRVVLSQKAEQALALLKQHGVYKHRV